MHVLTITLNSEWVLAKREDEVLPIEEIKNYLLDKYAATATVVEETFTELQLFFNADVAHLNDVTINLEKYLKERYFLATFDDVMTLEVKAVSKSPIDGQGDHAQDEEEQMEDETEDSSSLESQIAAVTVKLTKGEESVETIEAQTPSADSQEEDKVEACMNSINALIGSEEFKALASEIRQISSQIIQNKTFDTFSYQTYVFSINDGYGLSTYLQLFAKLLSALKIKEIKVNEKVLEEKLPPPDGDKKDVFADVKSVLFNGRKDKVTLLCIDISEWLNNINGHEFREFLIEVERHMTEFIVVFRVPFVEKEVLENIRESINDLMFARTVSFPPFTKSETQRYAQDEFTKYGFKLSTKAWDCFHERMVEEKADGRYYGINTIKKVVRELLYHKQLSNARRGVCDFNISKKDAIAICESDLDKGQSGYEMLENLVGGKAIKERIDEIISQILLSKNNPEMGMPCIHMRFVGNPGTGKTTVARIVGKILKEKGVLRIGNFYEYAGRDFCGRYIGETAPKTASMCRDAYGSVLFIDEAYSLYRGDDNSRDFGREALDTLIAEMENHRSDLVVIMAGYTDEMETLMKGNAGLASRMPYLISFPNFTREELYDIFLSMLKKQVKYDEDILSVAKEYFLNLPEEIIDAKEFANARYVRNLFERMWAKASMRCQLAKINNVVLTKEDFERATNDSEFTNIPKKKKNRIGFY